MALTIDEALNVLAEQRGVSPSLVSINDAIALSNQSFQQSFFGTPAPAPAPAPATFLQLSAPAPEPTATPMLSAPANYPVFGPAGPVQTPISTAPAPAPAPTPSLMLTPVSTTTGQPVAPPVMGKTGQYGYQNNAPVLNAVVAKQLLGGEFSKDVDLNENGLGWSTNSKYQGKILTGAGLYGIRDSNESVQKLLNAGETFKQLQREGKLITTTDPDTGQVSYQMPSGTDPDTGAITYRNAKDLFNTAAPDAEEGVNSQQNFDKWLQTELNLRNAANQLKISTANKSGIQLLNEINQKDKRIAVVGRTQDWDPTKTGGIGGKEGPQHAAVIYQQAGDQLIPASPAKTFEFEDPNTTSGFFGDLINFGIDVLSIKPVAMALSAFGAPYIASSLASQFGLSDFASNAIANGLISGTITGTITGDAEKALIAGLLAGGATYAAESGILGDTLDRVGLGEYKSTLNLLNSDQAREVNMVANDAIQLRNQGLGVQGIQDSLIAAGVDPAIAASAANQAVLGGTVNTISLDLAEFSKRGGLFTGDGTGPGVTRTTPPPVTTTPPPGTTPTTPVTPPTTPTTPVTPVTPPTTPVTPPTTPTTPTVPTGLLTGAAKVISDLFGGTSIKDLLNAGIDYATAEKISSDLQRQATGIQEQAAAAGRAAQVPFTPYTVTTGMGTTTLGPTGARMTATPAYQQLQQSALQQAQAALGAINPQQAAQTLFQQAEALAAPGRAREQEALLAGLQQRGLTGFGQNLPTVGGGVRTVNPLFESLLSAQEVGRAQQALQAQQLGTQEALRQQQLAAGLQGQAQNVDVQQLNQLLRAQGLSQDQINIALRNAEAQRVSSLTGLQSSIPLLLDAAAVRAGQMGNVGQAARNLAGTIFSAAVPSLFASPAANRGFGTGDLFGNEDYGKYFGP